MTDYTSMRDILQSERYVDKTANFEDIWEHRFVTLENCKGTGSSLFMKSLAWFLDESVDTKELFRGMEIGRAERFEQMANSFRVVWLDFSDFCAKDFAEATAYIRRKMAAEYKRFYHLFSIDDNRSYSYYSFENALDVIEETPSYDVLQRSLRNLLLQLRGYESYKNDKKLALLIDNMVTLELVATANGYHDEMSRFLQGFIVEDVYKYCDIFLQLADVCEDDHRYAFGSRFLCLRNFTVFGDDIRSRFDKIVVEKEAQSTFDYTPPVSDQHDWPAIIAAGRKAISKARQREEENRQKHILWEKQRYSVNLLPDAPRLSPNMGVRKKILDKDTLRYAELNALLRSIYEEQSPKFDADSIYHRLQNIDAENVIVADADRLCAILEGLADRSDEWTEASTNASFGHWVQVVYYRTDDSRRTTPDIPENIKVYACFQHTDIQEIFTGSIKYMLAHASDTFAAKIACCNRSDQMCYWLSPRDFKVLEQFFQAHYKDMARSMPFMAYRGMLGISKDFPGSEYSHNSTQAHIIADYFKTVHSAAEVDLEDMYNNYIARWNADIYEESDFAHFKRDSALSFVVILDTLDAILGQTNIADDSFLLSTDGPSWRMLAECRCWADVNEYANCDNKINST